jgi:hypothetical protein
MSTPLKLYRHYDCDGVLLYIGISGSWIRRHCYHEKNTYWFNEIATITLESFESSQELYHAERRAIELENPKYNIQYTPKDRRFRR